MAEQAAPTGVAPVRGTSPPREPGHKPRHRASAPAAMRGLRACLALPRFGGPHKQPLRHLPKNKPFFFTLRQNTPHTPHLQQLLDSWLKSPTLPPKGHQQKYGGKKPQNKGADESLPVFAALPLHAAALRNTKGCGKAERAGGTGRGSLPAGGPQRNAAESGPGIPFKFGRFGGGRRGGGWRERVSSRPG